MRMINASRATWLRTPGGWQHYDDIYAMTEDEQQLREGLVTALNSLKYQ